jgi:hypothetical protein
VSRRGKLDAITTQFKQKEEEARKGFRQACDYEVKHVKKELMEVAMT